MILYKCPTCENAQLIFDKDLHEDKHNQKGPPRYLLLGNLDREVYKSMKNKEPSLAYCEQCDCDWSVEQLEKEEMSSISMLKVTFSLMMLSVMLLLVGLLLLVFNLLVGAIVIASSALMLFITTILYKRY